MRYLIPVLVLAGGLALTGMGASLLSDESRSAGVFPGRVVAVDAHGSRTADVDFTGPDGRTRTATVQQDKRKLGPGSAVQVRVWPEDRRASLDHGSSHGTTIVVGGVVALLGAGAGAVTFARHRRERS